MAVSGSDCADFAVKGHTRLHTHWLIHTEKGAQYRDCRDKAGHPMHVTFEKLPASEVQASENLTTTSLSFTTK